MKPAVLIIVSSLITAPVQAHAFTAEAEAHDAWAMICQPSEGDAFAVMMTGSKRSLIIGSRDGAIRNNQIISTDQAGRGRGFKVRASGIDNHGKSRVLEAFFSPDGGYISVLHQKDSTVLSDPDHAASND
jgi:hypothetical protein